jgi:hypothetical protein
MEDMATEFLKRSGRDSGVGDAIYMREHRDGMSTYDKEDVKINVFRGNVPEMPGWRSYMKRVPQPNGLPKSHFVLSHDLWFPRPGDFEKILVARYIVGFADLREGDENSTRYEGTFSVASHIGELREQNARANFCMVLDTKTGGVGSLNSKIAEIGEAVGNEVDRFYGETASEFLALDLMYLARRMGISLQDATHEYANKFANGMGDLVAMGFCKNYFNGCAKGRVCCAHSLTEPSAA